MFVKALLVFLVCFEVNAAAFWLLIWLKDSSRACSSCVADEDVDLSAIDGAKIRPMALNLKTNAFLQLLLGFAALVHVANSVFILAFNHGQFL